ncbi:MAG: hypothetical protein J6V66_00670 [Clostridia bacterium]|nr:hypothetical protein [Clostridia bacterium]
MEKQYTIKELKKIFWDYVNQHGADFDYMVNNANIDYVGEQAVKNAEKGA